MKDYQINIFYGDDDDEYIAEIPDREAYSVFGATPEEALREVEIPGEARLDAGREEGKPIPTPRYQRVIYQAHR